MIAGLHEGGYHPTSAGYDINAEVEYYNGTFNQYGVSVEALVPMVGLTERKRRADQRVPPDGTAGLSARIRST